MKFYSGIGSRKAPPAICKDMTYLATELEKMGYWLISGNAIKSDQAFARGVDKNALIWLPSENFEKEFQLAHPKHIYKVISPDHKEAWDSIDKFHGAPEKLSDFGRACMARNWEQITNEGELSEFVICWTPEGKEIGGTAQALKIAKHFHVPIFNMYWETRDDILSKIRLVNLFKN